MTILLQRGIFLVALLLVCTISTSIAQAGLCAGFYFDSITTTHANGTFGEGEIIDINMNYDSSVFTVDTAFGTPYISLNTGGTAQYFSGNNTKNLTFRYTVANAQYTKGLDYASIEALGGGQITNATGWSLCNEFPAVGTFAAEHAIVIESRRGPRGLPRVANAHQKVP